MNRATLTMYLLSLLLLTMLVSGATAAQRSARAVEQTAKIDQSPSGDAVVDPVCPGDVNGDGVKSWQDALDMISCIFFSDSDCPDLDVLDFNGDGQFDIDDFVDLIAHIPALDSVPCDRAYADER